MTIDKHNIKYLGKANEDFNKNNCYMICSIGMNEKGLMAIMPEDTDKKALAGYLDLLSQQLKNNKI